MGTWVLVAAAGIFWQWGSAASSATPAIAFAWGILGYVMLQAPFDWMGGAYLPARYGRPRTSAAAWGKGVLSQALLWWLGSLVVFTSGQHGGLPGAMAAMAGWMAFLVLAQEWIARTVGVLQAVGHDGTATLISSKDPGFVGGWTGLGPTRKLLMPASWPEEWRAVQAVRRQAVLSNGSRAAGLLVAVCFNLAGLALSAILTPGAGFQTAGEYLHLVFGFTLWSFLGLLILPSISRPAVFLADQFAEAEGVVWQRVAEQLDKLQDDEPVRSRWIERIFHPIPSVTARIERVQSGWGAWHAARLALYLSWSVPGLLARSVHCNAGRPDLWVLFPGD